MTGAAPRAVVDPDALPRVLLVTDTDLSAGSRGAGRTLVNLFSRYPAGRLLAVSANTVESHATESGARVIAAAPGIPGRIAKAARRTIGHLDALWVRWRATPDADAIAGFAPELVLAVPAGAVGLALAERCRTKAPLITYLMDDWVAFPQGPQLAFNTLTHGRALLCESAAWLSISPYLLESTRAFTGVDRPAMVVHNPVPLPATAPAALQAPRTGRFRIAYAGSVWPMHWDAVAAVAQSVQRLRAAGMDIEFVLYTDRYFWGRYEEHWRRWQVTDAGLVPYAELPTTLGDCDLLLVASSFDPAQAHMSRSSIQTKVTDYMATGRPILACGPRDAASHRFLDEHECAFFAEDPTPAAVDATLRRCVEQRAAGPAVARRAWDVVSRDHELVAVTDQLYAFLAEAAHRR